MPAHNDVRNDLRTSDTADTDGAYALEVRAEVLQTIAQADYVRRGQSDRLEIGSGSGENGSTDIVAGTETVTVGGDLTETVGRERTNALKSLTTTVHGRMSLEAYQESFLMTGTFNETHHGGELLVAGMSDDLIGGIGVRTTAPADLWLNGLIGMEEKLATANNDVLMMDVYGVGMEREFGTSIHNIGFASIGGAVYTTAANGFMQLHQIQRGVRNTVPGGGGGSGSSGNAPGQTPPPASTPGQDGGASGVLSAARGGTGIDELAGAEDLENARPIAQAAQGTGNASRPNLADTVESLRNTDQPLDADGQRWQDHLSLDPTSGRSPGQAHEEFADARRPRSASEPNIGSRAPETLPETQAPVRPDDPDIHHADVPTDPESLSPAVIAAGNTASPSAAGNAVRSSTDDLWAETVRQFMISTVAHGDGALAKHDPAALNLMAAARANQALKDVEIDALNLYPRFAEYTNVSENVLSSDHYRLSNRIRHDTFPEEILTQDLPPATIREFNQSRGYGFLIRDEYGQAIERAKEAGDLTAVARMEEVLQGLDARASAHLEGTLEQVRGLQQWQGTPLPSHIDQGALQQTVQREIDLATEKVYALRATDAEIGSAELRHGQGGNLDLTTTDAYRQVLTAAKHRIEMGLYPIPYVDEFTTHLNVFYPQTEHGYWQLQGVSKARRNLVEWMSQFSPALGQGQAAVSETDGFLDNLAALHRAQAQYRQAGAPSTAAIDILDGARADVQRLAAQQLYDTSNNVGLPFPGSAQNPTEARAGFGDLHRELMLTGQTDKARQVTEALAELDAAADAIIRNALDEAGRVAIPVPLPVEVDAERAIDALAELEQGVRAEADQIDPKQSVFARVAADDLNKKADLYADARNKVAGGIDPRPDLQDQIRLLTGQGAEGEAYALQEVLDRVENILRSSRGADDDPYELLPIGGSILPSTPDPAAGIKPASLDLDKTDRIYSLVGPPGPINQSDAVQGTAEMLETAWRNLPSGDAKRDFPFPSVDQASEARLVPAENPRLEGQANSYELGPPESLYESGPPGNPYEVPRPKSLSSPPAFDGGYQTLRSDNLHEQAASDAGYGTLRFQDHGAPLLSGGNNNAPLLGGGNNKAPLLSGDNNAPLLSGNNNAPLLSGDTQPRWGNDFRPGRIEATDSPPHLPGTDGAPIIDNSYNTLRFGSNAHPSPLLDDGYNQLRHSSGQTPYLEDEYGTLPGVPGDATPPPSQRHTWGHPARVDGASPAAAKGPIDNPSHTIPGSRAPQSTSYPQPSLNHRRASWNDVANPEGNYDVGESYRGNLENTSGDEHFYHELEKNTYEDPDQWHSTVSNTDGASHHRGDDAAGIHQEPLYDEIPNSHGHQGGTFRGPVPDVDRPPIPTPDEAAAEFDDLWATAIHRRELTAQDVSGAAPQGSGYLKKKAHIHIEKTIAELNEFALELYRGALPEGTPDDALGSIGRAAAPPEAGVLPDDYLAANPQSRFRARDEYLKLIEQEADPATRLYMRKTLESFDRVARQELENAISRADYLRQWQGLPLQDHIDAGALRRLTRQRHDELASARRAAQNTLQAQPDDLAAKLRYQELAGRQEAWSATTQALKPGLDPTPLVHQAYEFALFDAATAVDDAAEAQAFADGVTAARREVLDWFQNPENWADAPYPDVASGYQVWLDKLDILRPDRTVANDEFDAAVRVIDNAEQVAREQSQDVYRRLLAMHGSKAPGSLATDGASLSPQAIRRNLETLQYHLLHTGDLDAAIDVQRVTEQLDADLNRYLMQETDKVEKLLADPSAHADLTPAPFTSGSTPDSTPGSISGSISGQGEAPVGDVAHGSTGQGATDPSSLSPQGAAAPPPAASATPTPPTGGTNRAPIAKIWSNEAGVYDQHAADLLGISGPSVEPEDGIYYDYSRFRQGRFASDPSDLFLPADPTRSRRAAEYRNLAEFVFEIPYHTPPGELVILLEPELAELIRLNFARLRVYDKSGDLLDPSAYRIADQGDKLESHFGIIPEAVPLLFREHGKLYSLRDQVVGYWAAEFGRVHRPSLTDSGSSLAEEIRAVQDGIPSRSGTDDDTLTRSGSLPKTPLDDDTLTSGASLPGTPLDDDTLTRSGSGHTANEALYGDASLYGDESLYGDVGEYGTVGRRTDPAAEGFPDTDDPLTWAANDAAAPKGKVASVRGQLTNLEIGDGDHYWVQQTETGGHHATPNDAGPGQDTPPPNAADLLFEDASALHAADEIASRRPSIDSLMRSIEADGSVARIRTNSAPN